MLFDFDALIGFHEAPADAIAHDAGLAGRQGAHEAIEFLEQVVCLAAADHHFDALAVDHSTPGG